MLMFISFRLDLAIGNSYGRNKLLLNSASQDGDWSGFVADNLPGDADMGTKALAFGDLNRDGWADIVLGKGDGADANQFLLSTHYNGAWAGFGHCIFI